MYSRKRLSGVTYTPVLPFSCRYGANIFAVLEPSEPSTKPLTPPMRSQSPPKFASTPSAATLRQSANGQRRSMRSRQFALPRQLLIETEQTAARGRAAAVHVLHAGDTHLSGLGESGADGVDDFLLGRPWNVAFDEAHGIVAQDAAGLPRTGLAINDAARRIGRLGGDAGQLQHTTVDYGHVAVVAAQEHRPLGDVFVDGFGGGQSAGEGAIMVPFATQQPAIARQLAIEVAQPFAELGFVLRVLQSDLRQTQAGAEQVNVTVVEPRHDAPPLGVEDTRLWADHRPHIRGLADGDNDDLG